MKISLLALGSRGDVQPYLALAVGLQQAGHQVTLAAPYNFTDWIQSYGVQTHPVSWSIEAFLKNPDNQAALKSRNLARVIRVMRDGLGPGFIQANDDFWKMGPATEFVVQTIPLLCGVEIARQFNLPLAFASVAPVYAPPTRAFPSFGLPWRFSLGGGYNYLSHALFWHIPGALEPLNRWRATRLGLPPVRSMDDRRLLAAPSLYGYSPSVLPKPSEWDATHHVTGYWFLEPPLDWSPPADLLRFLESGPPPIYIGFGSMRDEDPERLTRLTLRALELTGQRGVVATGWGGITQLTSAAAVYYLNNAPHAWLFPRMGAVVHHGGAGTTGAGLRAGVPSLITPFTLDQYAWADIVARLGVGPRVGDVKKLTAEKLAGAINVAVNDASLRARAAALGEKIRAENGIARAVEIIERHAAGSNLRPPAIETISQITGDDRMREPTLWTNLPESALVYTTWSWARIEPYYTDLVARELTSAALASWLDDWSRLRALNSEGLARLSNAAAAHTSAADRQARFQAFFTEVVQPAEVYEEQLQNRLLASGLTAPGYERPIALLRAQGSFFFPATQPVAAREQELIARFNEIVGGRTVEWDGAEVPAGRLELALESDDRARRERAWRLKMARSLTDRPALADVWRALLATRAELAHHAGVADFRAYRWRELGREYTPAACLEFHHAIEHVVVPVATRLYAQRAARLGLTRLRPWDLATDFSRAAEPPGTPPLRPFRDSAELITKTAAVLHRVDPEIGAYFVGLARDGLLDLDSRPSKAPGGFQRGYAVTRQSFILLNTVGTQEDVVGLLHEAGHAASAHEQGQRPFLQMSLAYGLGGEWSEVCSLGMELLSAPHVGPIFYPAAPAAAARAWSELLETKILFWPYMAVVDAFQHWVYTHPNEAAEVSQCDQQWGALWARFMPGVDWSGLATECQAGWQRRPHIFASPFFYIDYGIAELGALQIWRNARQDYAGAVAAYRRAMGAEPCLPLAEQYALAGARCALDAATLREVMETLEATLRELEAA